MLHTHTHANTYILVRQDAGRTMRIEAAHSAVRECICVEPKEFHLSHPPSPTLMHLFRYAFCIALGVSECVWICVCVCIFLIITEMNQAEKIATLRSCGRRRLRRRLQNGSFNFITFLLCPRLACGVVAQMRSCLRVRSNVRSFVRSFAGTRQIHDER